MNWNTAVSNPSWNYSITIINEIKTVFDEVVYIVGNTNENKLNEIPFNDSWTIGQVAEHIILCSSSIQDTQYKGSRQSV
ncbi:MAG: hypothetical protein QM763_13870 [Agriterribacter sp.]